MRPTDLSKDLVGSAHGRRLAPKRESPSGVARGHNYRWSRVVKPDLAADGSLFRYARSCTREEGRGRTTDPPPSTDFETKSNRPFGRERKKEADLDRIGLDLLSPVHLVPQRAEEDSLRREKEKKRGESLERGFFSRGKGRREDEARWTTRRSVLADVERDAHGRTLTRLWAESSVWPAAPSSWPPCSRGGARKPPRCFLAHARRDAIATCPRAAPTLRTPRPQVPRSSYSKAIEHAPRLRPLRSPPIFFSPRIFSITPLREARVYIFIS